MGRHHAARDHTHALFSTQSHSFLANAATLFNGADNAVIGLSRDLPLLRQTCRPSIYPQLRLGPEIVSGGFLLVTGAVYPVGACLLNPN